ncbi:PHP domain-containing protein [candidate division KSB1 bacterium]|nr:PHP domain-containing protein [candidate division KSB1 bacterium]MBL7094505.1 PHP domain-containing protein [candidate division KSB1 bacterium]
MEKFKLFFSYVILLLVTVLTIQTGQTQNKYNQQAGTLNWYKGNTHTHTLNSDGDSFPDDVVKWYRLHGYNFLVITDHNFLTEVDELNKIYGADEQYLIIQGDEVSDEFNKRPIHLNAINPKYNILPQGGKNTLETLQNNINAIRKASGLVHINHPNFGWAISADTLKLVKNCNLFEIYSGHPIINNYGGGGKPSVEQIWDEVLASGKLMYGVAVDDMHELKEPWEPKAAKPGQGWVMVRAKQLTVEAILKSLKKGNFYSSTGIELLDYEANKKNIKITYKEEGHAKYTVLFIGKGGKVLTEEYSNPAIYNFQGNEKYVRAKIFDSNGNMAWTQPVFGE